MADATTGPARRQRSRRCEPCSRRPPTTSRSWRLRVIATDAGGRDEWVGIDDIEVSAVSDRAGAGPIRRPRLSAAGTRPGAVPDPEPAGAGAARRGGRS